MRLEEVYNEIGIELNRAVSKFPTWPTDAIHASSIVQEEAGELATEVNQLTYEKSKSSLEKVKAEAIQTAAMAIRFLMSIDRYDFAQGPQHRQDYK